MKTTSADLEKVVGYLKSQVGWVELDKIRKAIPPKHANALKIEAMRHIGLLERDGENVKLTTDGRDFARGDVAKKAEVMRKRLRADPLYHPTLEWMHFNEKTTVTKTDVANYWHDNHSAEIGGAKGDGLTDSTVFFMRMVDLAELGKFIAAGTGRETHLKMDEARLKEFATGETSLEEEPVAPESSPGVAPASQSITPSQVNVGAGLNVNVEIHIAADAKPATIEEIFKNMRRYLLNGSDPSVDGD